MRSMISILTIVMSVLVMGLSYSKDKQIIFLNNTGEKIIVNPTNYSQCFNKNAGSSNWSTGNSDLNPKVQNTLTLKDWKKCGGKRIFTFSLYTAYGLKPFKTADYTYHDQDGTDTITLDTGSDKHAFTYSTDCSHTNCKLTITSV